jgi:hypothetical protein
MGDVGLAPVEAADQVAGAGGGLVEEFGAAEHRSPDLRADVIDLIVDLEVQIGVGSEEHHPNTFRHRR